MKEIIKHVVINGHHVKCGQKKGETKKVDVVISPTIFSPYPALTQLQKWTCKIRYS